jgi:hypothetical protein
LSFVQTCLRSSFDGFFDLDHGRDVPDGFVTTGAIGTAKGDGPQT